MITIIIIPSLQLGGSQRSLIKFLNTLVDSKSVFYVFAMAKANNSLSKEFHKNINLIEFNSYSSLSIILWIKIFFYVAKINPDIIVGWSTYANFIAILIKFFFKKKIILSERVYLPHFFKLRLDLRSKFLLLLIKNAYKYSDVLTANSVQNLKFMKKYVGPGPQYHLLPNTINFSDIKVYSNKKTIPHRLNTIKKPRLLALGRLDFQKGFDLLIRAFSQIINKDNLSWELFIIGDGKERANLELLCNHLGITRSVHFLGEINNPFPYYKWADIVIVPSRFEGFPNVLLEAMAMGKAVIAADCKTGPRELTSNGKYGMLFPVNNYLSLYKCLLTLGNSKSKMREYSIGAKSFIKKNFSDSVIKKRYELLLSEINI
jgi:glycosyltransferase involved in cell wall biosynthesis